MDKHSKTPNIILIIMDTTRVDHISCYGYHKKTTPRIDKFATSALLYKNAYSTAPRTLPSIASILTGTYPGYHGAYVAPEIFYRKLSEENITIAEILKREGFLTAGIVSCMITSRLGFNQGFHYFEDKIVNYPILLSTFGAFSFLNHFFPLEDFLFFNGLHGHRVADQINQLAISWLERNREKSPFFFFLHYFDSHLPYLPFHSGNTKGKLSDLIQMKYSHGNPNYWRMERCLIGSVSSGKKPLLPEEREYLVTNYDGEILFLDAKIGEILDKLKGLELYDNSLIIITADHGEAFGEHGLMAHGKALYEDNIHVPLIIKYPLNDVHEGIINYPVSLTGIVPTILSYLSIDPMGTIQGSSFQERKSQKIISQKFYKPDMISMIFEDYKYVKVLGGEDQLFNIKKDPGEKENLIGQELEIERKLKKVLEGQTKELSLFQKTDKVVEIDKQMMENLRALGYIK